MSPEMIIVLMCKLGMLQRYATLDLLLAAIPQPFTCMFQHLCWPLMNRGHDINCCIYFVVNYIVRTSSQFKMYLRRLLHAIIWRSQLTSTGSPDMQKRCGYP